MHELINDFNSNREVSIISNSGTKIIGYVTEINVDHSDFRNDVNIQVAGILPPKERTLNKKVLVIWVGQ